MDFQDGCHGGHLGFQISMILAIFDLQVTQMLLASLESIGLSVQEKKRKIDFQDGGHLGFLINTILASFDLQVFLASLESIGLSVQEKKLKIDLRWLPWRPSWIFDWQDFNYF